MGGRTTGCWTGPTSTAPSEEPPTRLFSPGRQRALRSETRLCTLSLNEDEQGVYFLVEKVVRDDDRVILEEDYGSGETFLIKLDDEDGFRVNDGGYGSWQLIYPDPDREGRRPMSQGLAGRLVHLDQPADIPQVDTQRGGLCAPGSSRTTTPTT